MLKIVRSREVLDVALEGKGINYTLLEPDHCSDTG